MRGKESLEKREFIEFWDRDVKCNESSHRSLHLFFFASIFLRVTFDLHEHALLLFLMSVTSVIPQCSKFRGQKHSASKQDGHAGCLNNEILFDVLHLSFMRMRC